MSRALNINATEAHVAATCAKHKLSFSAIEALQSGGTRLVMLNADDALAIGKAYGSKVLTGPVSRILDRLQRS